MTSGKFASTVGYEKRFNPALQIADRARFIEFMTADQPIRPANIANIVAINQGRSPLTMGRPDAPVLAAGQFRDRIAEGRLVVDTRDAADFGAGHIPGALNIQIASSEFEQRVGWVAPATGPLLLVAGSDDEARRALFLLAFLGLDQRVEGLLGGGMAAWTAAGLEQDVIAQISVHLLDRRRREDGIQILDVREADEWAAGHIEGATHRSYRQLARETDSLGLDRQEPVAVACAGGVRSGIACSLLRRAGYERLLNVTGGMKAWSAAGLPVV